MIIGIACVSCDRSDQVNSNQFDFSVHFPDTNLAFEIRKILDKPVGEINREELLSITSIEAIHKGIKYLDGIGFLSNLEFIDLSHNEIFDIEDLTSLYKLVTLKLIDNKLITVDSLGGLVELKYLKLDNNGISDISFLAYLPNLTDATLTGNYIRDIYPIVLNSNYGEGDGFDLRWNPLSFMSINEHIPTLRERGVFIAY